jgi:hypothetical protein
MIAAGRHGTWQPRDMYIYVYNTIRDIYIHNTKYINTTRFFWGDFAPACLCVFLSARTLPPAMYYVLVLVAISVRLLTHKSWTSLPNAPSITRLWGCFRAKNVVGIEWPPERAQLGLVAAPCSRYEAKIGKSIFRITQEGPKNGFVAAQMGPGSRARVLSCGLVPGYQGACLLPTNGSRSGGQVFNLA